MSYFISKWILVKYFIINIEIEQPNISEYSLVKIEL